MRSNSKNKRIKTFVNQVYIIWLKKWQFTKDVVRYTIRHIGHILTILATSLTIMQWIEGSIGHNNEYIINGTPVTLETIIIINGVHVTIGSIFIVVLSIAVTWAVLDVWPRTTTQIKHKDIIITVEVCDIFEQNGIKVIHTTDTFDMDRIKKGTVVAKFVEKCQENSLDIKKVISNNLNRCRYVETDNSLPGLKDRYELGSVCFFNTLSDENAISNLKSFCLVAFSHIHPGYVDPLSIKEYINTLEVMWQNLSVSGVGNDNIINITVVGDKNLRLPDDYNFTQKIASILETFFSVSHKGKFCDALRICISVEDMAKIDFQKFDAVMNFLSERNEYLPITN